MYNNYNNPYFNPYYRPLEQQYGQNQVNVPPVQQNGIKTILQGKLVDSLEVAKNSDYQLDGTTSYFVVADGSAIVSKQFTNEGISKVVVFKPIVEDVKEVEYITPDDLKKAINELNLDEIEDIKDELKDIKKKMKKGE